MSIEAILAIVALAVTLIIGIIQILIGRQQLHATRGSSESIPPSNPHRYSPSRSAFPFIRVGGFLRGLAELAVVLSLVGGMIAGGYYVWKAIPPWGAHPQAAEPPPTSDRVLVKLSGGGVGGDTLGYSPDGQSIASGVGRLVYVWNAADGAMKHTLTGHQADVTSLAYHPGGENLATGDQDGVVRLWSASRVGDAITCEAGKDTVVDIAYSADGTKLMTVTRGGKVGFWDGRSGLPLSWTILAGGRVAMNPDGRTACLVTRTNWGVTIVSTESGRASKSFTKKHGTGRPMFSPSGKELLTIDADTNHPLIWHTETGDLIRTIDAFAHDARFTPDGKRVVVAHHNGSADYDAVNVYDASLGSKVATLEISRGGLRGELYLSPDSRYAVITGSATSMWDLSTGKVMSSYGAKNKGVAFSPDGKRLALNGELVYEVP